MNRLPLRVALVAIFLPFALAVVGVGIQLAWLPDLPATIATHWGFGGTADAFGPAWSMPVLLAAVGTFVPALFGIVLARTITPAGVTATQKLLAVASLFAVTLLSIVVTASVGLQLGTDVGSASIPVLPSLGIALPISLALATAAWFFLPRAVSGRSGDAADVPPVAVAAGERVAWVGHARFSNAILTVLVATVALVAGLMAFAIVSTGMVWLVIVPVIVGVAVLGTASWTVLVDQAGLTVRATLGWPMYRVSLADLESAKVSTILALGEFGGYGIRWGMGRRIGIITRGGEALEARRRDGRTLVVTVDDAGTAAGLLTALAARPATS
jgi:hypothetical protein